MTGNKIIYRIFDSLRFPLVLLIVFMHCKGEPSDLSINWHSLGVMDFFNIFRNYISNVVSDIAVPTFFFMSGFLFYYSDNHFSFPKYINKIFRRFRKLLIPYFFWITLYLILTLYFFFHKSDFNVSINGISTYLREYRYWHIFWDCNVFEEVGRPIIGFSQDRSSPLLFPLWFVRDLFVTSLLSPVLWYCIRKIGVVFVVLLGLCHVFQIWPYIHGVSSVSSFFFSLGILFSFHQESIQRISQKWGSFFVLISMMLSFYLVYLFDTHNIFLPYIVRIFTIFGCIAVLWLSYRFQHLKIVSFFIILSPASFVIYAGHMVYVSKYVRMIAYHLIPQDNIYMLVIEYIAVPLFISFVFVLLYFILKRLCPHLLLLLNGGR